MAVASRRAPRAAVAAARRPGAARACTCTSTPGWPATAPRRRAGPRCAAAAAARARGLIAGRRRDGAPACADEPGDPSNAAGRGAVRAGRSSVRTRVRAAARAAAPRRDRGGAATRRGPHLVRVGAGLVGIDPRHPALRPALTLTAPVVQVRGVARRHRGRLRPHLDRTPRDPRSRCCRSATPTACPRRLRPRRRCCSRGRRRPLVGRVSMDQVVVDLGDGAVELGDVATVLGPGDAGEPTPAEWAALGGDPPARGGHRLRAATRPGRGRHRPQERPMSLPDPHPRWPGRRDRRRHQLRARRLPRQRRRGRATRWPRPGTTSSRSPSTATASGATPASGRSGWPARCTCCARATSPSRCSTAPAARTARSRRCSTWPGCPASAPACAPARSAMDKWATKLVAAALGIATAPGVLLTARRAPRRTPWTSRWSSSRSPPAPATASSLVRDAGRAGRGAGRGARPGRPGARRGRRGRSRDRRRRAAPADGDAAGLPAAGDPASTGVFDSTAKYDGSARLRRARPWTLARPSRRPWRAPRSRCSTALGCRGRRPGRLLPHRRPDRC